MTASSPSRPERDLPEAGRAQPGPTRPGPTRPGPARPKTVCVDLGWTLEDESAAQQDRAERMAAVCRDRGLAFDPAEFLSRVRAAGRAGAGAVYTAAVATYGFPADVLAELRERAAWRTDRLVLYPGVRAALEALATKHALVVLANQSRPIAGRLQAYGIADLFSAVVCSREVGREKPDPEIFAMVERRYPETELWMIGDRADNDIAPAKRLGWRTIRVLQGDHRDYAPRSAEETPDFTVDNFPEAARILA